MHDGGSELRFHVVAHDRQATIFEALAPVRLRSDKDWNAVYERASCLEDLLDIPFRRHLGADRQI